VVGGIGAAGSAVPVVVAAHPLIARHTAMTDSRVVTGK